MSNKISSLPQSIVEWLQGITALKHITFMTEYPPQAKAVPLKNSIVSVGLNEVSITDLFTENENGELVREEYCRKADMHITLGIHVPAALGGSTCHDVFTKVVDYMTFSSDFNIVSSTCGSVTSDRNTESLVMNADIQIEAEFCPADSTGINFNSFIDKTLFCKTHMADNDIHVSSTDRELWNEPCVSGTYTGGGAGTKTISLGFTPKFVFVFALGAGAIGIDWTEQKGTVYFGYAGSKNTSSSAVTCTTNGFKVHNGTSYEVQNVYPLLNEAGVTYVYYAVK